MNSKDFRALYSAKHERVPKKEYVNLTKSAVRLEVDTTMEEVRKKITELADKVRHVGLEDTLVVHHCIGEGDIVSQLFNLGKDLGFTLIGGPSKGLYAFLLSTIEQIAKIENKDAIEVIKLLADIHMAQFIKNELMAAKPCGDCSACTHKDECPIKAFKDIL